MGKDRVERLWRREELKVPKKQKPRVRLWLNDGSLRAAAPGAAQSCVVIRLRQHGDSRWKDGADAEPDRRIHAGVPGDPRAAQDRQPACDRGAWRRP